MCRQILRASGIDGAEIELARILARRSDYVLQSLEVRIYLHGKEHLETSRDRHEAEIGQHVVWPRFKQRRADRLPGSDHAKRVTICWRPEHFLGCEQSAGSRTIFDHDLPLRSFR